MADPNANMIMDESLSNEKQQNPDEDKAKRIKKYRKTLIELSSPGKTLRASPAQPMHLGKHMQDNHWHNSREILLLLL